MVDKSQQTKDEDQGGLLEGKAVSRRDFLKIAGIAGATIGVGAGLGGLVAACGGGTTTTTTAATTPTTVAPGTTTTAAPSSSTTVTSAATQGREIKIGNPLPITGVLASFGAYEKWADDLSNKTLGDGIVLGDGQTHKITIIQADTQSDSNRASQVAGDMITNQKVDFLISSGTPDTVDPTADQAEALGCPMVCTNDPMEVFVFGRGLKADTVQTYPYGLLFGVDQELITQPQAFDKVPNNKKIAILLANEADGNSWASVLVPGFKKLGYDVTFPQQYQPGTEDFTVQIAAFKKAGCDILTGTHYANDFSNFWKQTQQQGFKPKLVFIGGKCFSDFSFPKALGPTSVGMMANWLLHKSFTFTDSLTGKTVAQLCDQYEADTGGEWSENVGVQAARSWAVDCLKRATNIDDKSTIVAAIKTTKLETIYGPIDFTEPVSATGRHPFPNVYKAVTTTQQCVKGADAQPTPDTKFTYDSNVVGADFLEGLPTYQTIEEAYS